LDQLKEFQGKKVRVTYIERFGTFFWLGDTKYYVKKVELVIDGEKLLDAN